MSFGSTSIRIVPYPDDTVPLVDPASASTARYAVSTDRVPEPAGMYVEVSEKLGVCCPGIFRVR